MPRTTKEPQQSTDSTPVVKRRSGGRKTKKEVPDNNELSLVETHENVEASEAQPSPVVAPKKRGGRKSKAEAAVVPATEPVAEEPVAEQPVAEEPVAPKRRGRKPKADSEEKQVVAEDETNDNENSKKEKKVFQIVDGSINVFDNKTGVLTGKTFEFRSNGRYRGTTISQAAKKIGTDVGRLAIESGFEEPIVQYRVVQKSSRGDKKEHKEHTYVCTRLSWLSTLPRKDKSGNDLFDDQNRNLVNRGAESRSAIPYFTTARAYRESETFNLEFFHNIQRHKFEKYL